MNRIPGAQDGFTAPQVGSIVAQVWDISLLGNLNLENRN